MSKVKDKRDQRDWSQERLAQRSGISVNTVRRIEDGSVDPRVGTLQRLADALDCSVRSIIE